MQEEQCVSSGSPFSFQFTAGAAPTCPAAMDFNRDGGIDVSDPISLLGYLFLGGAPPPAPFPACEQLTGCPQDACAGA